MKSKDHFLTPEEAGEYLKSYRPSHESLIREEAELDEKLATARVLEWNPVVMAGKSLPGICFCTLFSGSSGNSLYFGESAGGGVLIDIGPSCRRIEKQLSNIGVMPEQIQGILLTHEHTDHCKGLEQWEKKYSTPLYSAEETLEELDNQGKISGKFPAYAVFDEEFSVGNYRVTAFPLSHDCAQCMGYRITAPNGQVVSIVPDTGKITEECLEVVPGSDLVCCENDYNTDKLWCGDYPTRLKERIDSDTGHLSTRQAGTFARKLVGGDHPVETIVLYHLSEHNNDPELAKELIKSAVHDKALVETAKKDKIMVFPLRRKEQRVRTKARERTPDVLTEAEPIQEENRKAGQNLPVQQEDEEIGRENIDWWLTPQGKSNSESVPKKPGVPEKKSKEKSEPEPKPKRKGPTLSR